MITLLIVAMPFYPFQLPKAAIPPAPYWWVYRRKTSKFF